MNLFTSNSCVISLLPEGKEYTHTRFYPVCVYFEALRSPLELRNYSRNMKYPTRKIYPMHLLHKVIESYLEHNSPR